MSLKIVGRTQGNLLLTTAENLDSRTINLSPERESNLSDRSSVKPIDFLVLLLTIIYGEKKLFAPSRVINEMRKTVLIASDDFSITCAVNLKRFLNGYKFRSLQLKRKKEQKVG